MAEGSIPSHQPFSKDAQSMDASTAKSMRKGGVCQGEMGSQTVSTFFLVAWKLMGDQNIFNLGNLEQSKKKEQLWLMTDYSYNN